MYYSLVSFLLCPIYFIGLIHLKKSFVIIIILLSQYNIKYIIEDNL